MVLSDKETVGIITVLLRFCHVMFAGTVIGRLLPSGCVADIVIGSFVIFIDVFGVKTILNAGLAPFIKYSTLKNPKLLFETLTCTDVAPVDETVRTYVEVKTNVPEILNPLAPEITPHVVEVFIEVPCIDMFITSLVVIPCEPLYAVIVNPEVVKLLILN